MVCLTVVLYSQVIHSQIKIPTRNFSDSLEYSLDSLTNLYGNNKTYDSLIAFPFMIALSRFPDLRHTDIRIIKKNIFTTMYARPSIRRLFLQRDKRRYFILVDTEIEDEPGIYFKLPMNAKIGLIAHELCHIAEYQNKSIWKMLSYTAHYITSSGKRKLEHQNDLEVLERGFGWQIYDFMKFVENNPALPPKYLEHKKRYYFRPDEYVKLIYSHPDYAF